VAFGVLAGLFIFTGFMARFYHQTERSLARRWSAQGDAAMKAGRVAEAIQDYRSALVYSRENGETSSANENYDLHLAEALAASGRVDEARSYFLALAEKEPGRASVNLELARLAARQGNDLADASRYYNAAIFGVWDTDPLAQRRAARIEYAKFLLDRGQTAEAQAQLFAMSAALPNATAADAPLHSQAGRLLMEAGANSQALAEFRRALQLDPESVEAMRGAGMAAFRTEDYAQAARELSLSSSKGPLSEDEKRALETSERVQLLDPFIATLSVQQRASRASYGFSTALKRLQSCAASQGIAGVGNTGDELQQLLARAAKTSALADERSLSAHPENLAQVMDLAFAMENAAGVRCGQGLLDDTALQLLARSHEGNGQ
jgi:tetratricopeptide (TPR) repeat protein